MLLRRRRPAHEAVIKLGINPLRRCQLAYGVVGEIRRKVLLNPILRKVLHPDFTSMLMSTISKIFVEILTSFQFLC